MTPFDAAAVFAAALALVVATFLLYQIYNSVVALRQQIDKAWANIGVALRQRHDELPNLVEAVRGEMEFEQGVLETITRLRAAYSPAAPIASQAATSEATSAAIRSLFAVVENYPALRSATNVLQLQEEIERIENVIADRRELYNDAVYRYNTRIAQVPATVLAPFFGWRPRPLFSTEPQDAIRPESRLSGGQ